LDTTFAGFWGAPLLLGVAGVLPSVNASFCTTGCAYGSCQCISGLAECEHNDCVVKTGPIIGVVVGAVVVVAGYGDPVTTTFVV
jgi:hypothetical protein